MALPTVTKTWTISANNRITFVSLLDTMQKYLLGVKNFLKTTGGYTVKGSSSAGTAAMDGVDRWTVSTDVTPRATVSAASQAWFVLTDANGCDILLDFQGASDDICLIAFSPGGLYVVAGTANNKPTATDEVTITSAVSVINATASADRLWNGWVDSTKKLCRFIIARSGIFVGIAWGVELTTSKIIGPPAVWSPAVVGWGFGPGAGAFANQGSIVNARVMVASVAIIVSAKLMMEVFQSQFQLWGAVQVEAQGSVGYPIFPMSIGSTTSGAQGKLATWFDWWFARSNASDGDTYGTLQFIDVNIATHCIWPWDGATTPSLT